MAYDYTPKDEHKIARCNKEMRLCGYRIETLELDIKHVREEHKLWHARREAIIEKYRAKEAPRVNAKGQTLRGYKPQP